MDDPKGGVPYCMPSKGGVLNRSFWCCRYNPARGKRNVSSSPTEVPATLYHYTSLASLRKIAESKKLWLSNVFFMNDYMEVKWLLAVAQRLVEERLDVETVTAMTYRQGPSGQAIPQSFSQTPLTLPYYEQLVKSLHAPGFGHVYCSCFSSLCDDLSQWRAYGDDGSGVCVGLDVPAIVEGSRVTTLDCVRVEYDEGKQAAIVRGYLEEHEATISAGTTSSAVDQKYLAAEAARFIRKQATTCKNPAFMAEAEWRIVETPNVESPLRSAPDFTHRIYSKLIQNVEFFERKRALVPYVRVDVPLQAFRELVVGPRFGGQQNIESLKLFLLLQDLKHMKLTTSTATYS